MMPLILSKHRHAAVALVLGLLIGSGQTTSARDETPTDFARLQTRLEELRVRWRVPGMSAAVVREGHIVWSAGFGSVGPATRTPATPDTVYHLASLTKPIAATALLQLVEAGKLDLDAPVARFGILNLGKSVRVRHLLTHTSERVPGETYHYSGDRFSLLDKVLVKVTGTSFAAVVSQKILEPLALTNTAPNPRARAACQEARRDPERFQRRLAQGYKANGHPVDYPDHFSSAAGLVSSVGDLARFSSALDDHQLLSAASQEAAYTPMKTSTGKVLPYGLGWFIQQRAGTKLVWHYGWWTGNSSLIVKVPERRLTFILLANSDGLSRKFDLGKDEDVTRSPFATAFLDVFGL